MILQLDLLPAEDVEPYLYTERRIEESLARYNAPRSAKSGGAATRGLEAGEFGICGIQGTTNGTMFITVTNGANVAEVFAYTVWHTSSVVVVTWTNEQSNVVTDTNTVWHQVSPAFNGLESAWECLTTNLVLTNGVGVYENANISSNARIRFYAVANRQDTDGDGLTDGMEIFIHHTAPQSMDTDGDGLTDFEEVQLGTEPHTPNIVKKVYFVDELPEEPTRRSSSGEDIYVTWSNLQAKAIYTERHKEGFGEYFSSNIAASIPPKYYLTKERIYHTECRGVSIVLNPASAPDTIQFILSQSNYCRKVYDPLGWPTSLVEHTCSGASAFSKIRYADCYNLIELVWDYSYTQPSTAFPFSHHWWETQTTCPPYHHTNNILYSSVDTCRFMHDWIGYSTLIGKCNPISTTESYNYRTNEHGLGCDVYSSPTYELYEEYLYDEYTDSMLEEFTVADLQMYMDNWDELPWGKRLVRHTHTYPPATNTLTPNYTYSYRKVAADPTPRLALQALRFRWEVPTETGVVYKIIWQEEYWPDGEDWPSECRTELRECNLLGTGTTAYSTNMDLMPPNTNGTIYLIPAPLIDLEIYMPAVMDSAEPKIPDSEKLVRGSVTYVNLDNDDADSVYDHHDTLVEGGDNELVKVKLKVKTSSLTPSSARLLATAGSTNVVIWTNGNKHASSAYPMGSNMDLWSDFRYESNWAVKTLWVEGISPHTIQQGTILKMEYIVGSNICADEAALTVVGVDKIKWRGKGNSLNDNDVLDADPNWPSGLMPSAVRVFPGARMENGTVGPARDKVTAEVALTVAPPHPIKLYLRSFDADDPTSASSPVDNEADEEDNRGISPAKAGQFTGESDGVRELVFQENVKTTNCEFQTTMQPGDNFRIVANGDRDFLLRLENHDATQDAGATAAEKNANKQRICNMDVSGTPAEREIRQPGNFASDVLTVWRFLHVEVDSMAAPPTTGPEKNTVDGSLAGVVGDGTVAQRVHLSVNLKTGLAPPDNSANLTAGTGNGRFENGWIQIGSGGGTPGQTQTSDLLGNGDDYVRKDAGIDIPASVSRSGQPDVIGKIIAWSGPAFTLNISSGTLSTNYNGGSLNVAGVSATISTISGSNIVNVTAPPTIPFVLHDDDVASHPYQPNTSLMQASDSTNQNLFAAAYVRPAHHVQHGTNIAPFLRNVEGGTDFGSQMDAGCDSTSLPRFWTVYIQGMLQGSILADRDPNTEPIGFGRSFLSSRGGAVFVEPVREYEARQGLQTGTVLKKTTIHEIGHQFTLQDNTGGLMNQGWPVPLYFTDDHLSIIRGIPKP